MSSHDSKHQFYVGYFANAPVPLAKWLAPRIFFLVAVAAIIAAVLVVSQSPFAASVFEFGNYRKFEGVVVETPYPMLRLDRPSETAPDMDYSRWYVVVFGKKGGAEALAGMHGKRVSLEAQLIFRDDQTMLELKDGSLSVLGEEVVSVPPGQVSGSVRLVGEIVDSKCFLGVMNPGNLKTHKACAVRCIAGGIPPVLVVRDLTGRAVYVLLADEKGGPIGDRVLDMVAEPVAVEGLLERHDALWVLKTQKLELLP